MGKALIAALRQKLADVPQCRIAAIPLLTQRDSVGSAIHSAYPRVVAVKVDNMAVGLVNARLAVKPF